MPPWAGPTRPSAYTCPVARAVTSAACDAWWNPDGNEEHDKENMDAQHKAEHKPRKPPRTDWR
eukprot:10822916-Alexandrium_andersonii.AAC.1